MFHSVHVSEIEELELRLYQAGFRRKARGQDEVLRMHHKDGKKAIAWNKKQSPWRKINDVAYSIWSNHETK